MIIYIFTYIKGEDGIKIIKVFKAKSDDEMAEYVRANLDDFWPFYERIIYKSHDYYRRDDDDLSDEDIYERGWEGGGKLSSAFYKSVPFAEANTDKYSFKIKKKDYGEAVRKYLLTLSSSDVLGIFKYDEFPTGHESIDFNFVHIKLSKYEDNDTGSNAILAAIQ